MISRILFVVFPVLAVFMPVVAQAANPEHLQRLLESNQCQNCDLSGADLKDTNLFGANLVNANLKGAVKVQIWGLPILPMLT